MKKAALISIAVAALAGVYFYAQMDRSADTPINTPSAISQSSTDQIDGADDSTGDRGNGTDDLAQKESHEGHDHDEAPERMEKDPGAVKQAMLKGLKSRYSVGEQTMREPLWQMQTLDNLKGIFQEKYGDNWLSELREFLRYAFPDLADELIRKMNAYQEYEDWTVEASTYSYNSPEERDDALWDRRYELFGDEAESIWKAEHQERLTNQGLQQLQDTGDFVEQRERYAEIVQEVYHNENTDNPGVQISRTKKFLELEGVQDNLHELDPYDQRAELRELRKDMGMNEATLDRIESLDEQRAEIREKGQRYEEQRKALEESVPPGQLSEQIDNLRIDIFGETEATFIRNEEEANYYRFRGRQKIGIN